MLGFSDGSKSAKIANASWARAVRELKGLQVWVHKCPLTGIVSLSRVKELWIMWMDLFLRRKENYQKVLKTQVSIGSVVVVHAFGHLVIPLSPVHWTKCVQLIFKWDGVQIGIVCCSRDFRSLCGRLSRTCFCSLSCAQQPCKLLYINELKVVIWIYCLICGNTRISHIQSIIYKLFVHDNVLDQLNSD